jgi:hypothetical protein
VLLADQDRGRWDRSLITEGQALVRQCLRRDQLGRYQIQAAINAVHSDAPIAAATEWEQILRLYDQLLAIARSRNAAERAHLTLMKERPRHPDGVADGQGQASGNGEAGSEDRPCAAHVKPDKRYRDGTEEARRHHREEPG